MLSQWLQVTHTECWGSPDQRNFIWTSFIKKKKKKAALFKHESNFPKFCELYKYKWPTGGTVFSSRLRELFRRSVTRTA